jgi:hypothetical protein
MRDLFSSTTSSLTAVFGRGALALLAALLLLLVFFSPAFAASALEDAGKGSHLDKTGAHTCSWPGSDKQYPVPSRISPPGHKAVYECRLVLISPDSEKTAAAWVKFSYQ